jgi:hypothetical protein
LQASELQWWGWRFRLPRYGFASASAASTGLGHFGGAQGGKR